MILAIFINLAVRLIALQIQLTIVVLRHWLRVITWPLRRLGAVLRHGWVQHVASISLLFGASLAVASAWLSRQNVIDGVTANITVASLVAAVAIPNVAVAAWLGVRGVALSVADATMFMWRGATERCPVHGHSHHFGLEQGQFVATASGAIVELCENPACDQCLIEAGLGQNLKIGDVRRYRLSRVRHAHHADGLATTSATPVAQH